MTKMKQKDETEMSFSRYAARINIQLLKAADFNGNMRERGIQEETTVQGACKASQDEKEVREVLQTGKRLNMMVKFLAR